MRKNVDRNPISVNYVGLSQEQGNLVALPNPRLVYGHFSITHFYPWLQNMCNVVVTDIPLNRYKRK